MSNIKSIGQGVRGLRLPKIRGFPLTLNVALTTVLRTNVLHCDWGHDLDLSGSRDVIGHVAIGLGISHFLLVVLWTQVSLSYSFRYILPKNNVLIETAESS